MNPIIIITIHLQSRSHDFQNHASFVQHLVGIVYLPPDYEKIANREIDESIFVFVVCGSERC